MPNKLANRIQTFSFEPPATLVRRTINAHRDYTHRCPEATLRQVAEAIQFDPPQQAQALAMKEGLPSTAVRVAIAFMHERGLIERVGDGYWQTDSDDLAVDAMIELHAMNPARIG